jgi:hypothetical protein
MKGPFLILALLLAVNTLAQDLDESVDNPGEPVEMVVSSASDGQALRGGIC